MRRDDWFGRMCHWNSMQQQKPNFQFGRLKEPQKCELERRAKRVGFPFFQEINWKKSDIWYTDLPMGRNKLSQIMSDAKKKLNKPGTVSNHLVRKTGIRKLLDANIPEIFVTQHSGMKNSNSLKSYKTASVSHLRQMCDVINNDNNNPSNSSRQIENYQSSSNNHNNKHCLFAGAVPVFNNCSIFTGSVMFASSTRRNNQELLSSIPMENFPLLSVSDYQKKINSQIYCNFYHIFNLLYCCCQC